MTLKYLKDQIWDEIEGANNYMAKALACKGTPWGAEFLTMANGELGHVNALVKMINEYYADAERERDMPQEVWKYLYPNEILPRINEVKAKVAVYKT